MTKKRRCSICHTEGHNSRTCKVRDQLEDNDAPKATSAGDQSDLQLNLTLGWGSSICVSASSQESQPPESAPTSNNNIREVQINKGARWTREEHLDFLRGIEILGKGAWKAISARYVRTRTANQISSHAQKYFKRIMNPLRRKRNPSIFDERIGDASCSPYSRMCQVNRQRNHGLHPLPPSPKP